MNVAFASDLSDLIWCPNPTMWIHGPFYRFRDFMSDTTPGICYSLGYGGEQYKSRFDRASSLTFE